MHVWFIIWCNLFSGTCTYLVDSGLDYVMYLLIVVDLFVWSTVRNWYLIFIYLLSLQVKQFIGGLIPIPWVGNKSKSEVFEHKASINGQWDQRNPYCLIVFSDPIIPYTIICRHQLFPHCPPYFSPLYLCTKKNYRVVFKRVLLYICI